MGLRKDQNQIAGKYESRPSSKTENKEENIYEKGGGERWKEE